MTQGRSMLYLLMGGVATLGLLAFLVPAASAQDAENPTVVLNTSLGDITIELDKAKAPKTVENFLQYVDNGFYDGTIFHRVIPDFMVQGGGFDPDMKQKQTREPIQNESGNGLSNARGTIAMARTNDPNSATAQFFINVANNAQLDNYGGGYAVFGKVTKGMDVVDKIVAVRTTEKRGHQDVPVEPIVIKSAKRAQ